MARAWRVARCMGCTPSTAHIDELLDERSELTGIRRLAARPGDGTIRANHSFRLRQCDSIRITLRLRVIGRLPR